MGPQVSALGDRTGPGAGVASASTSTAPQRSGPVLAWLILVAAIANVTRPVPNVALPNIGKAAVANACFLVPARPLVDTSIEVAAPLAPTRGLCAGVVEAP